MIVRLTDISARGLELNDYISVAKLNERMNEGCSNEIIFLKDPQCTLKIDRQISGLALTGQVKTSYRQPCARCAEELELPLTVPINLVLKQSDPENPNSLSDDVGITTYSGERIDLEPLLQEYIILSTSPYLRPEQDSNGKCLLCGLGSEQQCIKQENKSTINLGGLLKDLKKKS